MREKIFKVHVKKNINLNIHIIYDYFMFTCRHNDVYSLDSQRTYN